jgi:sigma-B regulation protein RsbU (phosphoserine phosphatase)
MLSTMKSNQEIERLKSAVAELTVLNELALAAGSSLETNQILDIIVEKSVKTMQAEQGSILLVTEQKDIPLKTLIKQENFSGTMPSYRVGTHITGWVLKNRQPLLINNLADDERFFTTDQEKNDIHSLLATPIWMQAQIIGILMVTNKKNGQSFLSGDLRLLSIIASQSGQLIKNAQLQVDVLEKKRLEHELDLARTLQMALLPKADPEIPGIAIASYFEPAETVSGDYYDYLYQDGQKLGIVIADVSGHGPSAALVMTLLKGVTHAIAGEFHSAHHTLQKINSVISRVIPDDVFITMQLFVFDMKNKILQFSNAGHNPALCYESISNSCKILELPGCALNLMEVDNYTVNEIRLNAHDLFLLYTDGIVEACNSKQEMFGINRLKESLVNGISLSVADIITQIKNQLASYCADEVQTDDRAMIAIKIL